MVANLTSRFPKPGLIENDDLAQAVDICSLFQVLHHEQAKHDPLLVTASCADWSAVLPRSWLARDHTNITRRARRRV